MQTTYLGNTLINNVYLGTIPMDTSLILSTSTTTTTTTTTVAPTTTTTTTCSGPSVGCYYQGGLVIYSSGGHGIIAALTDQTSGTFGCPNTTIAGATGTGIGTGQANTNALVAAGCGTAAGICDSLSLNGYTDWYLPSIDELALMYTYAARLGISTASSPNEYWSSTQTPPGFSSTYYASGWEFGTNSGEGWSQNSRIPLYRTFTYKIRACRSF